MADVFISYSREDRARAEQVARGLSTIGLDAFWDTDIPPGQTWADYIEGKLTQCRAVVVLWSEHSTKSQWVREEARMGRDKSKLIPAMLDASPPPFGFGEVQAANLSAWRGELNHPEWVRLSAAVQSAVGVTAAAPRPRSPQAYAPPPPAPQPMYPPAVGPSESNSPLGYIQKCLRLYVNGTGRAGRAEFWWWFLFAMVVGVIGAALDFGIGGVNPYTNQPNSQVVSVLLSLALICPNISLMSRRLHDIGWSGWIAAAIYGVGFLGGYLAGTMNPMGGALLLLAGIGGLVVGLIPSAAGDNLYGANPKGF